MEQRPTPFATRLGLFLLHGAGKLASLSLGAIYVSRPMRAWLGRWDRTRPLPEYGGRVGLVAHVFYPDLLPEILACWEALPSGSGLVLTTSAENVAALASAIPATAKVVAVGNRGRDIAPFLTLLNGGLLDDLDVVLKLHTKRSKHLLDGDIRRRLLFSFLAGSRRRVQAVLLQFEDERTGLVGWGATWRRHPIWWMGDREQATRLGETMGIAMPSSPAFFEGSMFWVRVSALRRLRQAALRPEDFEPEDGQTDGMVHHAVERLFAIAAVADGYSVQDLRARPLLAQTTAGSSSAAVPESRA